jgi:phosphate/phosphite/phosphonate ABC transporter binding protein
LNNKFTLYHNNPFSIKKLKGLMKQLLPLVLLGLHACILPVGVSQISMPTVMPTFVPTSAPEQISSVLPEAKLGTDKNPLILALPPSTQPVPSVLAAAKILTALLKKSTGYKFVSVIPPDEIELVRDFGIKNAHIGVLSPTGYLLASGQGYIEAAFARQQSGNIFYGAQFIARSDAGFISYYDRIKDENSVDATVALAQFKDKKPCWTDEHSPSGYIIPLGFLNDAGVQVLTPAFVAGHPTVVCALYAGGICDFGATYIDARAYPGLEDQYPDLMKKVVVIWRIPPIIPYETLVFVHGMDEDMRRALIRAFVDTMSTADGKSAMQTLYGFDAMQVVQDSQYADFRKSVKASGLDLTNLVK